MPNNHHLCPDCLRLLPPSEFHGKHKYGQPLPRCKTCWKQRKDDHNGKPEPVHYDDEPLPWSPAAARFLAQTILHTNAMTPSELDAWVTHHLTTT